MQNMDLETLHEQMLSTHAEDAVDYVFDALTDLEDLRFVRADIERDRQAFTEEELTNEDHNARIALVNELTALRKSGVVAKWAWAKKVWSYA